eukprot:403332687
MKQIFRLEKIIDRQSSRVGSNYHSSKQLSSNGQQRLEQQNHINEFGEMLRGRQLSELTHLMECGTNINSTTHDQVFADATQYQTSNLIFSPQLLHKPHQSLTPNTQMLAGNHSSHQFKRGSGLQNLCLDQLQLNEQVQKLNSKKQYTSQNNLIQISHQISSPNNGFYVNNIEEQSQQDQRDCCEKSGKIRKPMKRFSEIASSGRGVGCRDKSRSEFVSTQAASPIIVDDSSLCSFSEEDNSQVDGTSSVEIRIEDVDTYTISEAGYKRQNIQKTQLKIDSSLKQDTSSCLQSPYMDSCANEEQMHEEELIEEYNDDDEIISNMATQNQLNNNRPKQDILNRDSGINFNNNIENEIYDNKLAHDKKNKQQQNQQQESQLSINLDIKFISSEQGITNANSIQQHEQIIKIENLYDEDKGFYTKEYIDSIILQGYQQNMQAVRNLPQYSQLNLSPSHLQKILLPPVNCLPKQQQKLYTLILDMDETLIYCRQNPYPGYQDIIQATSSAHNTYSCQVQIFTSYRPNLRKFLEQVSQIFEVVIFTASEKSYADLILDKIDPRNEFFSKRLYRDSCLPTPGGQYVKDLTILGRDLSRTIIVDNSIMAFAYNISNGIPIPSYYGQPWDNELYILTSILSEIINANVYQNIDIRVSIENIFQITQKLQLLTVTQQIQQSQILQHQQNNSQTSSNIYQQQFNEIQVQDISMCATVNNINFNQQLTTQENREKLQFNVNNNCLSRNEAGENFQPIQQQYSQTSQIPIIPSTQQFLNSRNGNQILQQNLNSDSNLRQQNFGIQQQNNNSNYQQNLNNFSHQQLQNQQQLNSQEIQNQNHTINLNVFNQQSIAAIEYQQTQRSTIHMPYLSNLMDSRSNNLLPQSNNNNYSEYSNNNSQYDQSMDYSYSSSIMTSNQSKQYQSNLQQTSDFQQTRAMIQ